MIHRPTTLLYRLLLLAALAAVAWPLHRIANALEDATTQAAGHPAGLGTAAWPVAQRPSNNVLDVNIARVDGQPIWSGGIPVQLKGSDALVDVNLLEFRGSRVPYNGLPVEVRD